MCSTFLKYRCSTCKQLSQLTPGGSHLAIALQRQETPSDRPINLWFPDGKGWVFPSCSYCNLTSQFKTGHLPSLTKPAFGCSDSGEDEEMQSKHSTRWITTVCAESNHRVRSCCLQCSRSDGRCQRGRDRFGCRALPGRWGGTDWHGYRIARRSSGAER